MNNKDYTGLVFYIQTGKDPRKQMYKVHHQTKGIGRAVHDAGQAGKAVGTAAGVAAGGVAKGIGDAYNGVGEVCDSQPELCGVE